MTAPHLFNGSSMAGVTEDDLDRRLRRVKRRGHITVHIMMVISLAAWWISGTAWSFAGGMVLMLAILVVLVALEFGASRPPPTMGPRVVSIDVARSRRLFRRGKVQS
jgi:hypothetical protein